MAAMSTPPVMDLDLIDIDHPDAANRIAHACSTLGFFRLPGSVIDRAIGDNAWRTAAEFFALDAAVKAEVAFPEAGYPYGWSPYKFETLAASLGDRDAAPDLKESFSVGPDCLGQVAGAAMSPDEAWIRSPSLWPSGRDEMRTSWELYFRAMSDVSARLLSLMAVGLGLAPDYFEPLIDRHTSAMRALHYPAIDDLTEVGASLRAGAHTDYGTLTILRTDDVAGLEIRDPAGVWRPVEPIADSYVVNLGDSIQQWTNDRWLSTMHRVAPVSGQSRQSFAFFHMANWDALIDCLATCRSATDPPRHQPVLAGPWLMSKFQSTVT
jgi:isopenicillin N synthase-like dioxygenase